MNRLQRMLVKGNPALLEQELRNVDNAIWEENKTICLALNGNAELDGDRRNPRKRPWAAGIVILGLGIVMLVAAFSGSATGTLGEDNGNSGAAWTLPFNPIYAFAGLLFALPGYWMLFKTGRLIIDRRNSQWTLKRGVAPFVKTQMGRFDDGSVHWEMAVATRPGKNTTFGMWTLRLVGVPLPTPQFIELTAFDLQPGFVDHDTAFAAYSRIAERTGIPLVDATLTAAVEAGNLEKINACLKG